MVGVAFEIIQSDWPYRLSLPLFLRDALSWVAESSPRRRAAAWKTGQPLPLPPMPGGPLAQWIQPDGTSHPVQLAAERKTLIKETYQQGVYRLSGLAGGMESDQRYVANLCDPQESENATREELTFGNAAQNTTLKATPAAIAAKQEIWSYLALGAVGILLLEWWVFHRRLG